MLNFKMALITVVSCCLATIATAGEARAQAVMTCEIGKSFVQNLKNQYGTTDLFACHIGQCTFNAVTIVYGSAATDAFSGDWEDVAQFFSLAYACPTDTSAAGVCICPGGKCSSLKDCALGSAALLTVLYNNSPVAKSAASPSADCVTEDGCCDINNGFTLFNGRCGSKCNNFC